MIILEMNMIVKANKHTWQWQVSAVPGVRGGQWERSVQEERVMLRRHVARDQHKE